MKSPDKAIFQALLGRGYFPKELPLTFSTADFGIHGEDILQEWKHRGVFSIKESKDFRKVNGKILRGRYGYKDVPLADPEIIQKPKQGYEQRNINITHPVPQAILVRELASHWKQVHRALSKGRYSMDEILISDAYERSVKGINFPRHRMKKDYIESTADWLVKTDISRFYPSIYTHSIAWAAYGKEKVKSNIKLYEGSFADRVDCIVRACNRNQTVGLPIGPETSRIIAEIISSRIDSDFERISGDVKLASIDRLQDDWTIGVSTLEKAERALAGLVACYGSYGLQINGAKTSIDHIMAPRSREWKSEISLFLAGKAKSLHGARLDDFLRLCLRLQEQSPGEPILNYALAIIEQLRIRPADVELLESFLLRSVVVSPLSVDVICRIILNTDHETGGLSKERIVGRFGELVVRGLENGRTFEVIWLLYALRGMKRPFDARRIIELAEDVPSSAIRLLLLDMGNRRICQGRHVASKWEADVSVEGVLTDWSWLFAYEGIRKGWIADPRRVMTTPFLDAMAKRNVVFYNENRNVIRSSVVKRRKMQVRAMQMKEANELMRLLRGDVDAGGVYDEDTVEVDWELAGEY